MKNNVLFLVFLGFFVRTVSPPPVIPSEIVIDAAERLSYSGYLAMALTLQVVSQTLTSKSQASSFTLFAPSDDVFRGVSVHRPPPLQLLQYHFATDKYHPQKLFSLSFGTKIKTLYKNHYLCVTSSPHQTQSQLSINNISIDPNPIYNFGPIVVYGVRGFFYLNFVLPYGSTTSLQNSNLYPRSDIHQYAEYIDRAAHLLDSKYSVINDWMDLRVNSITVFALGNFTNTLISMHMVPCRLKWADIESLNDGDEIPTFVKGFSIKVSKSGRGVLLNGVGVVRPEVYHGERVIIHRIEKLLPFNLQKEEKHSAGLYCDRRTSIFLMVQPLMGISLYAMSKALVPRCSELWLAISLVSFELVSFIIEFHVKAVEVKLLTIPLAIALVYITFASYRRHPKSLKYMMFDLGFLLLTTELLVYIRITELVLSLPEWIELWAPYVFFPSLCVHFWEMMLLVFERMDKGDPISYILFVFLAAEIILMLVLVPLTLLRVLY